MNNSRSLEMKSRFLRACHGLEVDRPPVWLMRQAGRYLPEYQSVRKSHSILEICRTPELATKVTLQPLERFGFDAAILFADILLVLEVMGVEFEFVPSKGPVIKEPLRRQEQVERLTSKDVEEVLGHVFKAVGMIRGELEGTDIPLIGFAGAPFTVASYMVEGGSSRHFSQTKTMMYRAPQVWSALMDRITQVLLDYLSAQVRSGAQVIQIFDSWVGCLGPDDYLSFAYPYSKRILGALEEMAVPTIHFGTGTAGFLEELALAGGSVVGLDWRVRLSEAWERLGPQKILQGNLDPMTLFGSKTQLKSHLEAIRSQVGSRNGYIFNLGHGVLPETPIESIEYLMEWFSSWVNTDSSH